MSHWPYRSHYKPWTMNQKSSKWPRRQQQQQLISGVAPKLRSCVASQQRPFVSAQSVLMLFRWVILPLRFVFDVRFISKHRGYPTLIPLTALLNSNHPNYSNNHIRRTRSWVQWLLCASMSVCNTYITFIMTVCWTGSNASRVVRCVKSTYRSNQDRYFLTSRSCPNALTLIFGY